VAKKKAEPQPQDQLSPEQQRDMSTATHSASEAQELADKYNVQVPLNDGSNKVARPGASKLGDGFQPR
jgi:hypothetical protein